MKRFMVTSLVAVLLSISAGTAFAQDGNVKLEPFQGMSEGTSPVDTGGWAGGDGPCPVGAYWCYASTGTGTFQATILGAGTFSTDIISAWGLISEFASGNCIDGITCCAELSGSITFTDEKGNGLVGDIVATGDYKSLSKVCWVIEDLRYESEIFVTINPEESTGKFQGATGNFVSESISSLNLDNSQNPADWYFQETSTWFGFVGHNGGGYD